ncbi:MAG: type II toxin-antitoxin system RelE/ParE family toxin [Tannerella sp.]|jgi:plasmid stabilization system protein ParE|nr:type II toxin-antitoxin system RelE/ParE family toxin [Tannerella sp.]
MTYTIQYKPQALNDIEGVIDYIEKELFAPLAAERFAKGLFATIDKLRMNAGIFAISTLQDVLCYESNARTVGYKKFTIIYSVHGNKVIVHRIIHGSLIIK